ncbi:crosslink repair DNA glycosylase YcaQ family protein [Arthrobacter sp. MYb213]|uniref:winged helix-turn-helix domain-containing protein n=1 Tax=Arthrobacter sp. MYb213 TaxID=1848595 RepID=UPI0026B31EF8
MGLPQARRIALAAQGLSRPRAEARISSSHLKRALGRIAQLQIDSINVVKRAHYVPLFARLGYYDTTLLDTLVSQPHGSITEYWAHEASYVRSDLVPDLIPWQRRRWVDRSESFDSELRALADRVLIYLEAHPGTSARELSIALDVATMKDREHWGWNWNDTKIVTESLFAQGKILALGRNSRFERLFALGQVVLPSLQNVENRAREQALRRLVLESLSAQGIGTKHCIAEYFRLPLKEVGSALESLAQQGLVQKVQVQDITEQCYLLPETKIQRNILPDLRLLAPFDSMVFNRRRLELFFDFEYRVEIYVPKEKRRYGYYVFPMLYGDRFIGRVDLKADRAGGRLQVNSVHYESHAPTDVSAALDFELARMARWLGLGEVKYFL